MRRVVVLFLIMAATVVAPAAAQISTIDAHPAKAVALSRRGI